MSLYVSLVTKSWHDFDHAGCRYFNLLHCQQPKLCASTYAWLAAPACPAEGIHTTKESHISILLFLNMPRQVKSSLPHPLARPFL